MLTVEDLTFSYKHGHDIVSHATFDLKGGEIYGLLGPNGAGKSTLLYLICGLLTPNSGQVMFKGKNTRLRLPSTLNDIFILPEEFEVPALPVIEFAKLSSKLYPKFSMDDLKHNLEIFEIDPNQNFGQMSMGQRKKAYMSFALACNTSLILMDEPTNGLDIPGKSQFRKFIVGNINDDRTIIISTHQVRDIDKILDHVMILNNRRIVMNNSVDEITSKLKFITTDAQVVHTETLFAQQTLGGRNIIVPNNDGTATELNLESLFEFVENNPEKVAEMFNCNND